MKRILFSAISLAIPLTAVQKSAPPCSDECDPDLFKKNAQIYSAGVEFLYWKVAEGALDYALKMEHPAWGASPSYAQGKFETAAYNMDPGVRVGFLYFRAPHFWELKWQYTRFTSRGKNQASKPSGDADFLTGTWPQITTNPLAQATSQIHLNYNVFDMFVTRVFIPNPHLRLRVIGGTLAAWMDQDWKVHYSDSALNSTTIRNRWHFVGAGLKTGAMADWYWTGDLYMTGLWTVDALIGSYSNRAKQETSFNTAIPVRDTFYRDVRSVFSAQMLLGPSWQKNFPNNRVEVFAGFEMNLWCNLQEVYRSTAGDPSAAKETWINTSILALYGLTTRLTVDF